MALLLIALLALCVGSRLPWGCALTLVSAESRMLMVSDSSLMCACQGRCHSTMLTASVPSGRDSDLPQPNPVIQDGHAPYRHTPKLPSTQETASSPLRLLA